MRTYSLFLLGSLFFFLLPLFSEAYAVTPPPPSQRYYDCNDAGTQVRIDWNNVTGADRYWFRLDANPRSWADTCDEPGDMCATVRQSEITVPITPEVPYQWWVHAVNAQGEYSRAMDGLGLSCNMPLPYNIYYGCENNNTELYMNWSSTFGKKPERYELRFDAYPGSGASSTWSDKCDDLQDGDICASTTENNVRVDIEPGVPYRIWMHSVSGDVWSDGIGDKQMICGNPPTPTPTPTNTPVPTAAPTATATPSPIPTATVPPATPTVDAGTLTITPRTAPVCPRKSEGDADCNGMIQTQDFTCWRSMFVSNTMLTAEGCQYTDFNESDSTTLLDYAIWYVNFLRQGI